MNDIEEAISYIESTKKHLLHLGEIWYADYLDDAISLLKEQEELLYKKQKDIDRLCNEISEWKHKYHDRLLKEQETVVHPEPSCEMTYITNCCCDLCGVQLIREDIFCRCCGKRIVWESR